MRKIIAALVIAAAFPAFAFERGMTARQVDTEVAARVAQGQTTEKIASDAYAAGINASILATALVSNGRVSSVASPAMLAAGYGVQVVNAVFGNGLTSPTQTAILGGADPTQITDAPAAGGATTVLGTGTGFTGFSGSSFSSSRAGTIAGGSSRSVSPS